MPNKITYTITTSDGKSHQVDEQNINKYGMQSYADAYKGATIRMRDKDGADYDIPLNRFTQARGQGLRPFRFEHRGTAANTQAGSHAQQVVDEYDESVRRTQPRMTAAQKAKMSNWASSFGQNVGQTTKQATQALKRQNDARKDNALRVRRENVGVDATPYKLGENPNVVETGSTYNPQSGKVEKTYLTEAGNEYVGRDVADLEQNIIDDQKAREMDPVNTTLRDAYAERDRQEEAMRQRMKEIDEERSNVNPVVRAFADLTESTQGGQAYNPFERYQRDEQYRQLEAAARKNRATIQTLEDKRDNKMNDFFHSIATTAANGYTFNDGLSEINDAIALLTARKHINSINRKQTTGEPLTEEEQAAASVLAADALNAEVQGQYAGDYGAWARAGQMVPTSIDLMKDIMLTPGAGGVAKGVAGKVAGIGTRFLAKQAGETAAKSAAKAIGRGVLKGTGILLGAHTAGAVVSNTAGIGRTIGAMGTNLAGQTVKDAQGNYKVQDSMDVLDAFVDAERNQIRETGSEMFGEFLPGAGGLIKKGLEKIGLSKISNALTNIGNKQWYQQYNRLLTAGGYNGIPGEALEEYEGMAFDALTGNAGETWQQLKDPRTHVDIWLGTAAMSALLGAAPVTIQGAHTAMYYRYKHATDKADRTAAYRFGDNEKWNGLKDVIDNTPNEDMANAVMDIMNDSSLYPEQKTAALNYVRNLTKMRGYNIGQMSNANEESEESKAANESYANGYNTENPEELNQIKNRYEVAREKALQAFPQETLDEIENDNSLILNVEAPTLRKIVVDYLNTKQAYDGMIQRVRDDIDTQVQQSNDMIESRINKTTGMIQPAMMKAPDENGNERRAYVISGNVEMLADMSGVDREKSDGSILVRYADTGEMEMVSPSAIMRVDDAISPEQEQQEAETNITQTYAQQKANEIDGRVAFAQGDVYTLTDEAGKVAQVTVVPNKDGIVDNGDGTVNVDAGTGEVVAMPKDAIQIMIDRTNKNKVVQQEEPAAAVTYNLNDDVYVQDENGNIVHGVITGDVNEDGQYEVQTDTPVKNVLVNLYTPDQFVQQPQATTTEQPAAEQASAEQATEQQPSAEQQPTNEQQVEQTQAATAQEEQKPAIPTDEKGNMLYHQVPVETTINDLYDGKLDDNEIRDFVDANISEADKNLEKVNKKAPKIGTNKAEYLKKKQEWQKQVEDATRIRDYWNSVKDYIAQQTHTTPEEIKAAQDELSGEAARREYQDMGGSVQQDAVSVASDFIRGAKITPESFKAETGYGTDEQRKFVGMIAKAEKGGKTIDRLAEELVSYDNAEMNGVLFGGDTSSAKDAILSALQGAGTRGELKQTNEAEEQAYIDARNAARDAQYMEQYGMTYEEYLAYEEQIMPTIWREYNNYDETAFNNMYAEEIEQFIKSRENDTTGEEQADDRGNQVLSEQQVTEQRGSAGSTEPGTEVQAGVQGTVEDGTVQTATQENSGGRQRYRRVAGGRGQDNLSSQTDKVRIIPIGESDFGFVYDQFKGDAEGAIRQLMKMQDGEALGALHHKDIGDIDLVWGKAGTKKSDGYGLAKLVKYHPEVLGNLQELLDDMHITKRTDNRIQLENENYQAAIRLTWNGEDKIWLLTAFKKKETSEPANSRTDVESNLKDMPDDTATRQGSDVSSESKDTQTSANEQTVGEKIAEEEAKVDQNPTEAQKEAGNYKKGHVKIDGYDVTIEQPKGSVRSGVDRNGQEWSVTMNNTYGYIRGTEGVDGDHIDIFLSDNPTEGNVYVVDQVNPDGSFDEHKVMYGFQSAEDARAAYLSNYEEGWQGLGTITEVSKEEFKKWVNSSRRKTKPFAEYKSVKADGSNESDGRNESNASKEDGGGVRLRLGENGAKPLSAEETAIRDAVVGRLRESGLEVITDAEEGQRVLDEANGKRESRKRKSANNTALPKDESSFKGTVILFTDTANIRNNLETLASDYEKINNPSNKNVISELGRALNATHKGSGSQYVTIEAKNGNIVTIRLADHNVSVERMDNAGRDNAISIVISRKSNEGVQGEGKAHVVEYFYPDKSIRKAGGEAIASIARSLQQALYSGEYKDTTGLAEVEEVNGETIREQRNMRFFRTPNGEAYGFTVGGKIYIDPRVATADTPIHEYAHLWESALRQGNPEEWRNVVGLMKGTPVWDEVRRRYPELTADDDIADEVLATYSGRRGAERLKEETRKAMDGKGVFDAAQAVTAMERVKQALRKFWKDVADFLHIHYTSAEEVADRVMSDLLEGRTLKDSKEHDDTANFAKKHNLNEKDVEDYADYIRRGNLNGASRAFKEIRRKVRLDNQGASLGQFAKIFSPIEKELYERFGNIDELRQQYVQRTLDERNAMEAARKKAEEEAEKERRRQQEFQDMSSEQLDAEYMKAVEANDKNRMRDLVNEAARRNGYGDINSGYQGVGAWTAPSNPGYESEEERRKALESDGTDVNVMDVAEGYSGQPNDYFTNLRAYGNDTPHGKESAEAINTAVTEVREGKKPTIKVYRAVPKTVKEGKLRNGDWVTPSRKYAEMHGDNRLEGDYRIIEQDVPAEHLWWDGNDINEWGFDDGQDYAYRNTRNNRKLNDLITRDDKGNIIPLSQRFNARRSDVRFRFIGEKGAARLDAAEEATSRLDNLSTARQMEEAYNEKKARIEKLKDSKPVEITGKEIEPSDDLKQYKKNALEYGKKLQGNYVNKDTGRPIQLQRGRRNGGVNEVLQHDYKDVEHLQSVAAIPQIIENSVYIDSRENTDKEKNPNVTEYQYYVCGLKIGDADYTVRSTIAVDNKGNRYYDHKLTSIEKGKLLDQINGQTAKNVGFGTMPGTKPTTDKSLGKDKVLLSLLQTNDEENARKIKFATGWERGADGKWRYETPDFEYHPKGDARPNDKYKESEWYKELHVLEEKLFNGETLTDGETKRFDELSARVNAIRDNDRNTERIYLDDYVEDNELFKAYPELKQTRVDFVDIPNAEYSAKYNEQENRITVNQAKSIDDKSAIAHEVQHAIQHIEGFAKGSNVDNYNSVPTSENVINDIIDATDGHILDGGGFDNTPEGIFNALNRKTTYGTILRDYSSELDDIANKYGYETIFDLVNDIDKFKSRVEMYLSEAGEVEARNVEARINMTPEQRRQSLASETEDVAREDQLFIYDNLGVSARQGAGALTDSELSNANDPAGKMLGKPSRTPAQQKAFAERERQRMADRAREVADILHLDNVEIVTDASTLQGRRAKAKGFYSRDNGKIVIVVPNHVDMADIEQTVLHEAVAHYGLRKLFGSNFDTFINNVYNNADENVRREIVQLAAKHNWDFATATEEYLASLAESTNFEDMNASWWNKIKDLFLSMVRSIGLKGFSGKTLSDNELRYILWRSYENLKNPGRYRNVFSEAEDIAKQNELKVGNYAVREAKENVAENGVDDIESVNRRFNEELEGLTEENKDRVTLTLGRPSPILRAAGVEDRPMKLYGNKVIKKMKKHGFKLDELKDLPEAVANPIAVFKNYGKDGNRSVLTELKTEQGNFLVTLTLGEGHDVDFNIVTSVFGKGESNIIDWINRDFATYINKEKALNYLHHSALKAVTSDNQELSSAANIVRNFDNPSISEDKVEKNDVLYREVEPEERRRVYVADIYDARIKNGMYQMREAVQDSMLSLREAMTEILKAEGNKNVKIEDIAGFENAYLGENRLSSVNKAEADAFANLLFKPLLEEAANLSGSEKGGRDELVNYMMAKHGLERNKVMAERDAKNEYDNYVKEHPKGEKTLDDFIEKYRKRDYAGLTALTGKEKVAEAEAEAQQMVDDYEAEHDTKELWNKTRAVSNAILDKEYDTGLMSKDTMEKLKSMFDFYIPLRGFDEKTSEDEYAYLENKNSAFFAPIKAAKGRKSKADDPFAYLQGMAENAIMQGNRNKLVKQKFLNFVLNHQSDLASVSDLWLKYNEVNDEWEPVFPDNIKDTDTAKEVERKMQEFEERMKQLAEENPELYKHGRQTVEVPYRVVESRDLKQHQILVRRNGRNYVITINGNPRAAQAVNGLTNPDNDMSGAIGAILKAGQNLNRQLSAFYTTRNPDFVVSNFIRDALYANSMVWVKERPNYALRFNKNYNITNPAMMKILFAKYRNNNLDENNELEKMFKQFILNGGETGYTSVRDIERRKNEISKEIKKYQGKLPIQEAWGYLAERFDELNRAVENSARFAAFVTSREMGRSIERSIYDAKEISVNFNKKGSGSKFMGATGQTKLGNAGAFISGLGRSGFVFWNAAIQGSTNFGRQVKRNPAKALTAMATMFMLGAVVASLGYGDNDDDDKNSYWNLPDYVRRSNIMFRAGDQWVSIPLPVEYRSLYGLGELMISTMSDKEHLSGEEIANQIAGQISQVMPIDFLEGEGGVKAFIPSFIKPFAEAYGYNRSWTGLPIYKDTPYNKDMPEWTKAYKSANKYLVDLSETLNEATGGDKYTKGEIDINPAKIEHVLTGYFGGIANTIDRLTKMGETVIGQREYDPNSFLIMNRIIKNVDERTEYKAINNEYFRIKEEHDKLKKRLNNYERDTDNGVFDYTEKIDFLYNSPEYRRLEIYEEYQPDIEDLILMMKETNDANEQKDIEAQINELKKMMISDINKYTRK